jgi:hypothetical protein
MMRWRCRQAHLQERGPERRIVRLHGHPRDLLFRPVAERPTILTAVGRTALKAQQRKTPNNDRSHQFSLRTVLVASVRDYSSLRRRLRRLNEYATTSTANTTTRINVVLSTPVLLEADQCGCYMSARRILITTGPRHTT